MRIGGRVLQPTFQLTHHFITEHMLDLLGVFVDVVRGDLRGVGQIQFPEPVIPHNGAGELPARGREENQVAFLVQRGEFVPAQLGGATRGFLGDVLLSAVEVITGPLEDKAQDFVAGKIVERIDGQVDEAVYALNAEALTRLKGQPRIKLMDTAADGGPTLKIVSDGTVF